MPSVRRRHVYWKRRLCQPVLLKDAGEELDGSEELDGREELDGVPAPQARKGGAAGTVPTRKAPSKVTAALSQKARPADGSFSSIAWIFACLA